MKKMTKERRLFYLKVGLALVIGWVILDRLVIGPGIDLWKNQSARIADLRQKISNGKQLKQREASLRERWSAMRQSNLPLENSLASDLALQAFSRWQAGSRVTFNRLTDPRWQPEDGAELLKYSVTAAGTQEQIARFLHELESDPAIPVALEEYEIITRDPRGAQLQLTARLSFLRLKEKQDK